MPGKAFGCGVLFIALSGTIASSSWALPNEFKAGKKIAITIVDEKGRRVDPGSPSAGGQTFDVTVSPGGTLSFSPDTVNIIAGDTVRWTWDGSGHNVRSGNPCVPDGSFCSTSDANCDFNDVLSNGAVYSHTFGQVGTFSYFCSIHCGRGMVGNVNVTAPFVALSALVYNGAGFVISGKTMPGRMVTIQAATGIVSGFATIGMATANGSGDFQFIDSSATSLTKRFYRVVYP